MTERILGNTAVDGEITGSAVLPSQIKLANRPYFYMAVPCGLKDDPVEFVCPACQERAWLEGRSAFATMPVAWQVAFKGLVMPMNTTSVLMWHAGSLSAHARQVMTKKALAAGAVYILYWDDDVLPPKMAIRRMHTFMQQNPSVGAVSGVYVTRSEPVEPYVYRNHGEGACWDFELGPDARPEPVFGVGGGFLLARAQAVADAIELLKKENNGVEVPVWADESEFSEFAPGKTRHIVWGHDIRFCHWLNRAGWPVYVDGGVLCGHYDMQTGKTYEIPGDAPGFKLTTERMARDAESSNKAPGALPFVEGIPTDTSPEGEGEAGAARGADPNCEQTQTQG